MKRKTTVQALLKNNIIQRWPLILILIFILFESYQKSNFDFDVKAFLVITGSVILGVLPMVLVQVYDIKIGKPKPRFVEGGGIWWAPLYLIWLFVSLGITFTIFGSEDQDVWKVMASWLFTGMLLPANAYMTYIHTRYKRVVQYKTAEWARTPLKEREGYKLGRKLALILLALIIVPVIYIAYAVLIVEPTYKRSDKCLWPGRVATTDYSERPDHLACDMPPYSPPYTDKK